MELKVLGSNSSGNCYLLVSKTETLIIEAGIHFTAVKKALDFDLSKVVGCLSTHSHGDHSMFINNFIKSGIHCYSTYENFYKRNLLQSSFSHVIEHLQYFNVGEFRIRALTVQHDVPCLSFLIEHEEMGLCYFATDTCDIPYEFTKLNNLIIEANYSDSIAYDKIMSGRLDAYRQERVENSHLSLAKCKEFIEDMDSSQINNIVLIHLSNGSSNAVEFKNEIKSISHANVHIADKGLNINFDKTPF
jgi:phosphoribosyl 1,2-cyclic phosphodiesterase